MQKRAVEFPYEDGTIRLEYDPEHAAPEAQQIAVVLNKTVFGSLNLICRWLAGCVVFWSASTDETVVSITVEALQDLPVRLVALMCQAVVDDLEALASS